MTKGSKRQFKRGQRIVSDRLPMGSWEWVWDVAGKIVRYSHTDRLGAEWYMVNFDDGTGGCMCAERLRAA